MAKVVDRDGVVVVTNSMDVPVGRFSFVPNFGSQAQNTQAIINAITAAKPGDVLRFEPTTYNIQAGAIAACLNDKQGLYLQGSGIAPNIFPYGSPTVGTIFKATGGSGKMLSWVATGKTATGLMGNGIDGIAFDCNSIASDGVDLASHQGFRCPSISVYNANGGIGISLRTVDLSGVEDFQQADFGMVTVSQTTGKAMKWSSWQDGGGNVSLCRFGMLLLYVGNTGTCLEAGDSDHNVIDYMELNRSGTATGLDLLGAVTGPFSGHARSHQFNGIDGPAPIVARATGYMVASGPNYVKIQTGGNSQPFPTIEPGANLAVQDIT